MKQLVKAVLAVMDDCKGIEKSLTVGTGNSSYKGVSDKDVKLKVGESMRKNGLIILPTGVKPNTTINSWEETGQYGTKMKQNVFTEVITEYLLAHDSGETVTLVGFGHGADPQDKAAGKATTYALKYTLLYSFLVATGYIDDTDNVHSDDLPVKPPKAPQPANTPPTQQSAPKAAVNLDKERAKAQATFNKLIEKNQEGAVSLAKNFSFVKNKYGIDQLDATQLQAFTTAAEAAIKLTEVVS